MSYHYVKGFLIFKVYNKVILFTLHYRSLRKLTVSPTTSQKSRSTDPKEGHIYSVGAGFMLRLLHHSGLILSGR